MYRLLPCDATQRAVMRLHVKEVYSC